MRFLHGMLEIIFPSKCAGCGAPGTDLCFACLSSSPPAERKSAAWIFPIYDYRHPVIKKSLWLLKYKGKRRLARIFAEIMYENMVEELAELTTLQNFTDPLLIPIPLSKNRYHERGFNQSSLISGELAEIAHLRCGAGGKACFRLENNILIKPKDTPHQARVKGRALRLKNISGSFAVKESEKVKGRNIILVDDILTTGATLSEAKKTLRHAGARKVIAFTVAH